MPEEIMHQLLDTALEAIKGKKQDNHAYNQYLSDDMIYCKFIPYASIKRKA